MSNYKIKNIDYEGCPPEIAQVISKGKMIQCYVSKKPHLLKDKFTTEIMGYARTYSSPFRAYDGQSWKTAVPIEKKVLLVKEPVELMKQLIVDGYEVDDTGLWYCSEDYDFSPEMWLCCGEKPSPAFVWKAEWFESRRVR